MDTASAPLASMPASMTPRSTRGQGSVSSAPAFFRDNNISAPTKAPTMKISEWAKLMNSSTPYTIV